MNKTSPYWNERILSLTPYIAGEQPKGGVTVKLNTNENPYPPSPAVAEAANRVIKEGALRRYPDPECTPLREALAARFGVNTENVFCGNGSDEVLAFAFSAFFGRKDAPPLRFPDITYSFYPVYARLWGVPFETVPLSPDFTVNPADYLAARGGAILANPNAPTGLALPSADLRKIAESIEKDAVLIVDEAYAAFGGDSVIPFLPAHPNLLVTGTLSKAWALAGLRVGFALGAPALIEALRRVRDSFNSYTVDSLAQAAGAAALRDTEYYADTTARIIAARERTGEKLRDRGFTALPSRANFLFIRHPTLSGVKLFTHLRERGVLVRHFASPARIADFLRVSIGTAAEMETFLDALPLD